MSTMDDKGPGVGTRTVTILVTQIYVSIFTAVGFFTCLFCCNKWPAAFGIRLVAAQHQAVTPAGKPLNLTPMEWLTIEDMRNDQRRHARSAKKAL